MASTKVVVTRSLVGMFRFRVTPVAPLTECHVLVRVERRMASCKFFDRSAGGGRAGVWRCVRKAAGISVRFHDGRHTLVTNLAEAGVSHEVIRSTVAMSEITCSATERCRP